MKKVCDICGGKVVKTLVCDGITPNLWVIECSVCHKQFGVSMKGDGG